MAVRTAPSSSSSLSSSFDRRWPSSRVVDAWYRFVVFAALYALLTGRRCADALEPSRCAPKVTKSKVKICNKKKKKTRKSFFIECRSCCVVCPPEHPALTPSGSPGVSSDSDRGFFSATTCPMLVYLEIFRVYGFVIITECVAA